MVKQDLNKNDRSIIDGEEIGYVEKFILEGENRILGANVMSTNADEIVAELTLAM